jgi:hypothetical protein
MLLYIYYILLLYYYIFTFMFQFLEGFYRDRSAKLLAGICTLALRRFVPWQLYDADYVRYCEMLQGDV